VKLYHGTAAKNLDAIKAEGLRPRGRKRGNWSHSVNSNPKAVYLTDAYAFHFAFNAGEVNNRRVQTGLILEVERDSLSPWKLCPDEDVLEQATRGQSGENFAPVEWDMKRRTMFYRKIAPFNPKLVDTSLKHMGTCAYYGSIPWSAVTRYVLIEWSKLPQGMFWNAVDTSVSCLNYRILQDRQRALTRWFFGDPVTVEDFLGFTFEDNPHMREHDLTMKQATAIEEELKQRTGVEVVNVLEMAA